MQYGNATSSGIGNGAVVVTSVGSSSAPALGDLLRRFTSGHHRHGDGDDARQQSEEVKITIKNSYVCMMYVCMYQ